MNGDTAESPPFMKGLELSEALYQEGVKPILDERYPELRYSAAHIGGGSDVLGFDTAQSMDHDWGPKLLLFLEDSDHKLKADEISTYLSNNLPHMIRGFHTNFGKHDDETSVLVQLREYPINHGVQIKTIKDYFETYLGIDSQKELTVIDWLVVPEQFLRSITSGKVFYDGLHELETIRTKLEYYPRDVWFYLLSNQWRRLSQEIHFMGRCGQVGDDLGSRLIAARLVQDIMKLCFLMEKKYAPFIKWFGSAFSQLSCSSDLIPLFIQSLSAENWEERQKRLVPTYEYIASMHNELGITGIIEDKVTFFHNRPFLIIQAEDFAEAIYAQIQDNKVKSLPKWLGSVNQYTDSTDVLGYQDKLSKLRIMYE
ncbi:MAG: DUF4037 domain-containing protein [Candidatus Thorarchaeota archaeon]